MKKFDPISNVLTIISMASIAFALFSAVFLVGAEERILSRVAGIFLVLSTVASAHVNNRGRITGACQAKMDAKTKKVKSYLENLFSAISIISALMLGYLIFIASDNLPYRKFYVLVTCGVFGAGLMASNLTSFVLRRMLGSVDEVPNPESG